MYIKHNISNNSNLILAALLIFTVLLIYGKTYNFGYALDDHLITSYVPETKNVSEGINEIFNSRYNKSEYRPITIASFFIEQLAFGQLNSNRSHQVNVLLYLVLLLTIYYILYEIGVITNEKSKFVLWATLFLFAVHPIHANVVSNIKCRDNLLSAIFLILTCVFLVKIANKGFKIHYLLAFVISFILSLISKLDGIGLVIYAPFIVILFKHKNFPAKQIPYKTIAFAFFIPLATLIIRNIFVTEYSPLITDESTVSFVRFTENPIINSVGLWSKFQAMLTSFLLYFKMLIIPKGYYFYFGYNTIQFPLNIYWNILSIAILLGLLILYIKNSNNKKGISFAIIFMIGNLLYCVNFVIPVAGIVAARYAFIASFGFCLLIVYGLNAIQNTYVKHFVLVLILVIYGFSSFNRVSDWKNLETLIESDIPHLAKSHEAQRIAANAYIEIGDTIVDNPDLQHEYYLKALDAISKSNSIYSENYITHFHEGIVRFKLNDFDGSILSLQKSISLDTSFNSNIYEILGDAYFLNSDFNNAINTYKSISKEQPNNQDIIQKISSSYYEAGDITNTLLYNDSIIRSAPNFYAPYENLAYFYWLESDDSAKAYNYLEEALKRSRNKTHKNEMTNSFDLFVNKK